MFIHEAIFKLLSQNPSVSGFVESRIYPNVAPQKVDEYPIVVFRHVYREGVEKIDAGGTEGDSRGSSGLAWKRFRFFSVGFGADGYEDAVRLDRGIRLALQGFQGVIESDTSPVTTCEIQGIFKIDGTTRDLWDDKTQTYQTFSDFEIHYSEEQPVYSS